MTIIADRVKTASSALKTSALARHVAFCFPTPLTSFHNQPTGQAFKCICSKMTVENTHKLCCSSSYNRSLEMLHMVSAAPALMKRFLLWAECSLGLLQAGAPLCLRVFHSTVLSAELGTRHTVLNNGLEWGRAVFRRAAETWGLPRVQGAWVARCLHPWWAEPGPQLPFLVYNGPGIKCVSESYFRVSQCVINKLL